MISTQVKLTYEDLQQRQEELTPSSCTPPRETGRVMREWLRESQEATKELLKLKDHLIEVERNVSSWFFLVLESSIFAIDQTLTFFFMLVFQDVMTLLSPAECGTRGRTPCYAGPGEAAAESV